MRQVATVAKQQGRQGATAERSAFGPNVSRRLTFDVSRVSVQCKREVGAASDPAELEADRVAERVMSMSDGASQLVGRSSALQRKCAACDEPEELVQRQAVAAPAAPSWAPPIVSSVLSSPGAPIEPAVRAFIEPRFGHDFSGVRIHADERAAQSARAIHALAYTSGRDIVFDRGQYAPHQGSGMRLLAHELAHVVQQGAASNQPIRRFHRPHGPGPDHRADETPLIAPRTSDILTTIRNIINDASRDGFLSMDRLVQNAGGQPSSAELDRRLGTHSTPSVPSLLNYRYVYTCRCGLLDMRHFIQLMYMSNFTASAFPGVDGNRSATRRGREHELGSESESRFGPEDTTSNAIGAFTGARLAGIPQPDDVYRHIERAINRCSPIDFVSLSPASRSSILDFYSSLVSDPARPADLIPEHQNQTAVPEILGIAECGGRQRSFPYSLDTDDPTRATLSGEAFDTGSVGLTSDGDIRDFVAAQRRQTIEALSGAEKLRLVRRLFEGWVSDEDLDAIEVIYRAASSTERSQIRAAIDPSDVNSIGQRTRLRLLFEVQ